MPRVVVGLNEHISSALRRFARACHHAGIFDEIDKREFYRAPARRHKRKVKARAARGRHFRSK